MIELVSRTIPELARDLRGFFGENVEISKGPLPLQEMEVMRDLSGILADLESNETEIIAIDHLGKRMMSCWGQKDGTEQDAEEALRWIIQRAEELSSIDYLKGSYNKMTKCLDPDCQGVVAHSQGDGWEIQIPLNGVKDRAKIGDLVRNRMNPEGEELNFYHCPFSGCRSGPAVRGILEKLKGSVNDADKEKFESELAKQYSGVQTDTYEVCPEVSSALVLFLKTWDFDMEKMDATKIRKNLNLEVQKLQEMWGEEYALAGILRHVGKQHKSGHWVALTRDKVRHDSAWHEHQNGLCQDVARRTLGESGASVLVFRKVDADEAKEFNQRLECGRSTRRR